MPWRRSARCCRRARRCSGSRPSRRAWDGSAASAGDRARSTSTSCCTATGWWKRPGSRSPIRCSRPARSPWCRWPRSRPALCSHVLRSPPSSCGIGSPPISWPAFWPTARSIARSLNRRAMTSLQPRKSGWPGRAGGSSSGCALCVQEVSRMDAIAVLKRDHEEVERLFRQFEKLTERAHRSKQKIVMKIIRELAIHAAVEEMLFYPAVRTAALKANLRALKEAADTVLESLEEHHVVKWTLSELEKMKPEDERYDAKVQVLMESVRHHVEEEQEELFPKARRLLGEDLLFELGDRIEKAKKIAPTRPHPRAPDEPPGNLVAGTVAAVMDRAKDMVRDGVERLSRRGGPEANA